MSTLSIGCKPRNDNRIITKTSNDILELRKIIKFPFAITKVQWELEERNNSSERTVPGPNDYNLLVLFECNLAQMKIIKDSLLSGEIKLKNIYLDSSFLKVWFDDDIKSIFYSDGKYLKIKSKVFNIPAKIAGSFFNTGWISIIGDRKILLVAST